MTERRIRVIWNSKAGGNAVIHGAKLGEPELLELMARHGLGTELVASQSEEEARAATKEARDQGYDVVVAAGGDGTVGLVANELLDSPTALGILPMGTVMNVARQLGIPREIEGAAKVIEAGWTRRVDVGMAEGEPFFESAGVGISAAVMNEMSVNGERHWGALPGALRRAFQYRPRLMRLDLDGGQIRARALLVTIAIGPYLAAGMTVAPDAKVDDGKFDVTVFRHFSKKELALHMLSIAFGRRAYSPHTRIYRSAKVRVHADRPLPVRADGRDLGDRPIQFTLRPRSLTVIAAQNAETISR